MPNTQFITLLIITVFSMLAGIVSAVVLFGQLNAKKRERAELERKLENTVGAAMNSSVGNASAELERRLQDRLKELSDALYRYNEQTKNDYERFKNALNESIASSMRETASRLAEAQTAAAERISAEQKAFSEKLNTEQNALSERLSSEQRTLSDRLAAGQDSFEKQISDRLAAQNTLLKTQAEQAETRNKHFETVCTEKLAAMDASVKLMTERNEKQLDAIRGVVDEKLQETLTKQISENFKLVDERLKQVYQGLGEMQTLASGVGDLKKVLSNVKTRGILGEIQLGAILSEILTKEQYEENIATKKGSKNVVEFAIKLPADGAGTVYLPVDSKFPGDTYSALRDAVESCDKQRIESAQKALVQRIKGEAKDIHDKYIDPPNTTEFAIMFLPFEGLYSEVVNMGLVEVLQREYKVNIAGPSTMAALLNSLQMGFKTLAVQKRSAEVWKILGGVKTEFDKFNDVLVMTQQRLDQANKELDKLVGVRTRQIQRQLKDVESVPLSEQNLFE